MKKRKFVVKDENNVTYWESKAEYIETSDGSNVETKLGKKVTKTDFEAEKARTKNAEEILEKSIKVNKEATDEQLATLGAKQYELAHKTSDIEQKIGDVPYNIDFIDITPAEQFINTKEVNGKVVQEQSTTTVSFTVKVVENDKIKIYIHQTNSATYPYWAFATDDDNNIIGRYAPKPDTTGCNEYNFIIPNGAKNLYVQCNIGRPSRYIKKETIVVEDLQKQINEIKPNADNVPNLNKKINLIDGKIGDIELKEKELDVTPEPYSGNFKGSIGEKLVTDATTMSCYAIDVAAGDKIKVYLYQTNSATYPHWVFTTDDDKIINGVFAPKPDTTGWNEYTITVPQGATKLYMQTSVGREKQYIHKLVFYGNISDTLKEQNNRLIALEENGSDADEAAINKYGLKLLDTARAKILDHNSTTKLFNLAFVTDTHADGYSDVNYTLAKTIQNGERNLKLFSRFANEGIVDCAVHGGDLYNSYLSNRNEAIGFIDSVTQILGIVNIPMLYAKGNHDNNPKTAKKADMGNLDWSKNTYFIAKFISGQSLQFIPTTQAEWDGVSQLYMSGFDNSERLTRTQWYLLTANKQNVVFNEEDKFGGYFYKDFDDVRLIVANVYDTDNLQDEVMTQTQQDWLKDVALNTDKTVVCIAHTIDSAKMLTHRLTRFVENGGTVAALIKGHLHEDGADITTYPYPVITVGRGYATNTEINADGNNAFCFSVFSVDTQTKKVYETRVGRGSDREFTF